MAGPPLPPFSIKGSFTSNGTYARIHTCRPGDDPEKEAARAQLEDAQARYRTGMLSPQESVELREEIDRLSRIVDPNIANAWPPYTAAEQAYIDARRVAANNLGLALLGPVLGAPAIVARQAGAPEPVVQAAGEAGLNIGSAFGGEPARGVVEPVRAFEPPTSLYVEPVRPPEPARPEPATPEPPPPEPAKPEPAKPEANRTTVYPRRRQNPKERSQQRSHVFGTREYDNRIKQGKPTSYFENEADMAKYTKEAWDKGTLVPTTNPGEIIKDYDFGFRVGYDYFQNGPQTIVRVVQDSQGNIHGFPFGPVVPNAPDPPGG
jgi:hypothetical protein